MRNTYLPFGKSRDGRLAEFHHIDVVLNVRHAVMRRIREKIRRVLDDLVGDGRVNEYDYNCRSSTPAFCQAKSENSTASQRKNGMLFEADAVQPHAYLERPGSEMLLMTYYELVN
jgi:hypothetical protein